MAYEVIWNASKMHFAAIRGDIANYFSVHLAPSEGRRSLSTWFDIVDRDGFSHRWLSLCFCAQVSVKLRTFQHCLSKTSLQRCDEGCE